MSNKTKSELHALYGENQLIEIIQHSSINSITFPIQLSRENNTKANPWKFRDDQRNKITKRRLNYGISTRLTIRDSIQKYIRISFAFPLTEFFSPRSKSHLSNIIALEKTMNMVRTSQFRGWFEERIKFEVQYFAKNSYN